MSTASATVQTTSSTARPGGMLAHASINLTAELLRLKPPATIKKSAALPEILWLTQGRGHTRQTKEFGKQVLVMAVWGATALNAILRVPDPSIPLQIAFYTSFLAPLWVFKGQLVNIYHIIDQFSIGMLKRFWPKSISQPERQQALARSLYKPRSALRTSATQDIERYFRTLPGHYIRQVESAARDLGPLKSDNRISVIVPVAAHEEQDQILSLLHSCANQRMPANHFDLNLFLNYPAMSADTHRSAISTTIRAVETAQNLYPQLRINSFVRAISEGFSIGFMRKLATDARLYAALEAGRPDLKLLRWDADTRAIHPQALQTFDTALNKTPLFGVALGRHRYDIPSLMHDPLALFSEWLWQSLLLSTRHDYPQGGPPNSATVAWRYAIKGGYDPHARQAEDVALDRSLINMGAPFLQEIRLPATSTVWTDGRRLVAANDKGFASHEQWTACHFGDDNQTIRSSCAADRQIDVKGFLGKLDQPDLGRKIADLIERSAQPFYIKSGRWAKVERRLGFKCKFSADGKVESLKWEMLRRYLIRFANSSESKWKKIIEAR